LVIASIVLVWPFKSSAGAPAWGVRWNPKAMVVLGNNAAVVALCLTAAALVACAGENASGAKRLSTPATPREEPTHVDGFVRDLRYIDVTFPDGEAVRFDSLITRPVGTGPTLSSS
jgi:hypothetical protein